MARRVEVVHFLCILLALATAGVSHKNEDLTSSDSQEREPRQLSTEDRLSLLEADVVYHSTLIQLLQIELINERARVIALENETMQLRANSSELDARVKSQAALIQMLQVQQVNSSARLDYLETDVSHLQSLVSAAASSAVSFTVRFSDDDNANGVAIGPREILKFDLISFNVGEGYNATSGMFTAPVSGVYNFYLTLMGADQRGQVELAITTPTLVLGLVYAQGSTDLRDQGSTQVSTHLVAGEQAWVRQELGNAVRGNWWTTFTGYLVHQDRGQ